jgi:hypothetical protein
LAKEIIYGSGLREDFGEMKAFRRLALALEHAFDLHKAARIVGDDVIGTSLKQGGALNFAHGGGNGWEFDGEGATKSTTGLGFLHFQESEALNMLEQFARLTFDAQFTQAVAAVVEGHGAIEAGSDIAHAEFIDEKIGELVNLG